MHYPDPSIQPSHTQQYDSHTATTPHHCTHHITTIHNLRLLLPHTLQVGYYPDFQLYGDGSSGQPHENPSDRRQAMAPFLAHKLRPGFKWLLMMDTDMLVYRHGLKELTEGLDHTAPLWITSAIGCRHPHGSCLQYACPLCSAHQQRGAAGTGNSSATAQQQQGCPACSPHTICQDREPEDVDTCLEEHWPVYHNSAGEMLCRDQQ
jgi:hypothetical protein